MKQGIKFRAAPLCASLAAIANSSGHFITREGRELLHGAANRLTATDSSPKQVFVWSTGGQPVKSLPSRVYKGAGGADELEAHFWFRWRCERLDDCWIAYEGSVNVELHTTGDAAGRYGGYHVDICEGGLHVEYDSDGVEKEKQAEAGVRHCFAHSHIDKAMPRLPSVLVTPPDVLEFALTELWPTEWKRKIAGSTGRTNQLKPHHLAQRRRIHRVLSSLALQASNPYPITALHDRLKSPVELA